MPLPTLSRPTGYPGWASGASGIDAGRVVEPSSAKKATGWQDAEAPPATFFNWAQNLIYQWIKNLDESRGAAFVGDGSDGDLILVNQTFVATRQMQIRDLALGLSGVFKPNGWPWAAHLLTGVSGTIEARGPAGGTGVSGAAFAYPTGAAASQGPLRGYTGLAQGDGAGVSFLGDVRGGRGGTGGRGSQAFAFIAPQGIGATGTLRLAPPDGTADVYALQGPTRSYARGGAPGSPGTGDGSFNIGARGGGGGDLVAAAIAEVNFVGTIDVRGGDGGRGFRGGASGVAESGGPGGGGGGGAAYIGIGRRTRFDVNYLSAGGLGGLPASPGTGTTGGAGATGRALYEIPLP